MVDPDVYLFVDCFVLLCSCKKKHFYWLSTTDDFSVLSDYDAVSWNFSQTFQVLLVLATTVAQTQWASVSGMYCNDLTPNVERPHSASITDFGAVGDGTTLNTKAFQNALFYLNSFANKGGAQLFVPAGRWLTGSFSLINHLTLSLDKDAVILGSPVRWFNKWFVDNNLPTLFAVLHHL